MSYGQRLMRNVPLSLKGAQLRAEQEKGSENDLTLTFIREFGSRSYHVYINSKSADYSAKKANFDSLLRLFGEENGTAYDVNLVVKPQQKDNSKPWENRDKDMSVAFELLGDQEIKFSLVRTAFNLVGGAGALVNGRLEVYAYNPEFRDEGLYVDLEITLSRKEELGSGLKRE